MVHNKEMGFIGRSIDTRRVKVLHVTPDEKFFDRVFAIWNSDPRLENEAIYISNIQPYNFKYIKSVSDVTIYSVRDAIKYVKTTDCDIVFFHSLRNEYYKIILEIPKDKIVIWWGWGWEIYNYSINFRMLPPIIRLDLYKPNTKQIVKTIEEASPFHRLLQELPYLLYKPILFYLRRKAIKRVDYFQPVIKLEYNLLNVNKFFRAKEFYYNNSVSCKFTNDKHKSAEGQILIGNSSIPTNNHLDIYYKIESYINSSQKVIIPLNYGDVIYGNTIRSSINSENVIFITEFLDVDTYWKILKNCSYACFGVIRQQSMGNINFCIRNGIKLFLYKDSIVYKCYKEMGFVVFAIEDIDEHSFNTPMTSEQIENNLMIYEKEYNRRQSIYERFIDTVIKQ